MAKKSKVNKSQVVRDYLAAHPDAMPKDVRAALAKEGIEVSRVLVSTVKNKVNRASNGNKAARKATKKKAVAVEAAPAVVQKPTNGGITLEQVKMVAHMLNRLGGIQRLTEVLEVIKDLGGVKKFRDLAEAMSAPTSDDIPF